MFQATLTSFDHQEREQVKKNQSNFQTNGLFETSSSLVNISNNDQLCSFL